MTDISSFFNEYSDALTVIFIAVVTLSTLVYAIVTGVLVSETRKMKWEINILDAESNVVQADPGAVLFIVGLFLVLLQNINTNI